MALDIAAAEAGGGYVYVTSTTRIPGLTGSNSVYLAPGYTPGRNRKSSLFRAEKEPLSTIETVRTRAKDAKPA